MAGASVVPLPVLVERVDLHPPPGVGHRAGRGPPPEWPGDCVQERRAAADGNLRDLSAAAGRRGAAPPLAWPAPGSEPRAAAFARRPLLGAIVQAG